MRVIIIIIFNFHKFNLIINVSVVFYYFNINRSNFLVIFKQVCREHVKDSISSNLLKIISMFCRQMYDRNCGAGLLLKLQGDQNDYRVYTYGWGAQELPSLDLMGERCKGS